MRRGVSTRQPVPAAPFHAVVAGRCLLEMQGSAPLELRSGDLAVFPHGNPHSLMSDAGVPSTSFARVLE
ncbi:MAG: cupin domain-containing protein, partial [Steroidobacteraceae bacterium]